MLSGRIQRALSDLRREAMREPFTYSPVDHETATFQLVDHERTYQLINHGGVGLVNGGPQVMVTWMSYIGLNVRRALVTIPV